LPSYHAVVGDVMGLVVEAAGDQDSVDFPRYRLITLFGHELIEPA
jgi:hypothetical protein